MSLFGGLASGDYPVNYFSPQIYTFLFQLQKYFLLRNQIVTTLFFRARHKSRWRHIGVQDMVESIKHQMGIMLGCASEQWHKDG